MSSLTAKLPGLKARKSKRTASPAKDQIREKAIYRLSAALARALEAEFKLPKV